MLQDASFQLSQLGAGIEAEFVGEKAPRVPVRRKRVGLPAAAIQREHQLQPESFAQRLLCNELLDVVHHFAMSPELEQAVDMQFQCFETQLTEPLRGDPCVALERHVLGHRASPDSERLFEQRCRAGRFGGRACFPHEPLESCGVEGLALDFEDVPG